MKAEQKAIEKAEKLAAAAAAQTQQAKEKGDSLGQREPAEEDIEPNV